MHPLFFFFEILERTHIGFLSEVLDCSDEHFVLMYFLISDKDTHMCIR
jgi:TnpA family transposase